MSEESTSQATGPAPQATEDAYPLDQLINNSQAIFGQPPYVLEGAIAAASQGDTPMGATATKTDMQAAIDAYLAQTDPRHAEGGQP